MPLRFYTQANLSPADTAAFVYEVFHAVRTRSYKAGYVPPLDVPSYNPPLSAPSGPSGAYGSLGAGRGSSGGLQESRKRSYNDHQENGSRGDSHYARGDRQIKQLRRGGRGGRENGFGNRGGRGGFQDPGYSFPQAVSPQLPPTFPNMPMPARLPFDPNDPMAAIMAMQAMGLPPLPGMPTLHGAVSPEGPHQFGGQGSSGFAGSGRRERCRDYDTQGYCARGDSCPYEHGTDRLIAPNQDGRESSYILRVRIADRTQNTIPKTLFSQRNRRLLSPMDTFRSTHPVAMDPLEAPEGDEETEAHSRQERPIGQNSPRLDPIMTDPSLP